MVQRGHVYAIVDEVDSILVDEARTPLIISGPLDDRSELYNTHRRASCRGCAKADYELDEKQRTVAAHRSRHARSSSKLLRSRELAEGRNALRHRERLGRPSRQSGAARPHALSTRRDYIVKDDKVIIIDEFTGRMMQGRRYSEGLHQALEAKEHVTIQPENQTLASITFQNYFRMYPKLAGMTGTALTEADEFARHLRPRSAGNSDQRPNDARRSGRRGVPHVGGKIPRDHRADQGCQMRGQPVLVGTVSIEKSEKLSEAAQARTRSRTRC